MALHRRVPLQIAHPYCGPMHSAQSIAIIDNFNFKHIFVPGSPHLVSKSFIQNGQLPNIGAQTDLAVHICLRWHNQR